MNYIFLYHSDIFTYWPLWYGLAEPTNCCKMYKTPFKTKGFVMMFALKLHFFCSTWSLQPLNSGLTNPENLNKDVVNSTSLQTYLNSQDVGRSFWNLYAPFNWNKYSTNKIPVKCNANIHIITTMNFGSASPQFPCNNTKCIENVLVHCEVFMGNLATLVGEPFLMQ